METERELYELSITTLEDDNNRSSYLFKVTVSDYLMEIANKFKAGVNYEIDWSWAHGYGRIKSTRPRVKTAAIKAVKRINGIGEYIFTEMCEKTRVLELRYSDIQEIEQVTDSWRDEMNQLIKLNNLITTRKVKAILEEDSP